MFHLRHPAEVVELARKAIEHDVYLSAVKDKISWEFISRWMGVGMHAALHERSFGAVVNAGCVSSLTSSALTISTLGLPNAEALVAQKYVRDGYALARGPQAVRISTTQALIDFRLSLFAKPDVTAYDFLMAWVKRTPQPSYMQSLMFEAISKEMRSDESKFVKIVMETNQWLRGVADLLAKNAAQR